MKVLITGTGGMGAHISKVLVDNNVDCSLYGTCRQTEAISKIVDLNVPGLRKFTTNRLIMIEEENHGHNFTP